MTQDQIDKLPNPPFKPARDMMLCQRESKTVSGIHLPDEAVDKVQTCRVLVVGHGLTLDSMAVKRCPYRRGDRIFITPTDGYPIKFDGETFWLVEVNEVMGQLLSDDVVADGGRETC